MIDWESFSAAVERELGLSLNEEQEEVVRQPAGSFLWVAAGPGSGKTTALALRLLKLILVDGVNPAGIMATTFTRKAASELRSRVLEWGIKLYCTLPPDRHLDLNQMIIGTLDSIAQEVLGDHRLPGEPPPTVVEEFVSERLLLKALLKNRLHRDPSLAECLALLTDSNPKHLSDPKKKAEILREIRERIAHDRVDFSLLRHASYSGITLVCQVLEDYRQLLESKFLCDYAALEEEFLAKLTEGTLTPFLDRLRCLLVDEYQDTNFLQEEIYLHLARACREKLGGLTVVGDDDQALFRFRGATVELFGRLGRRLKEDLGIDACTAYLCRNYRSSRIIVDLVNHYITMEPRYQEVRMPGKPPVQAARPDGTDYPVLGLFRPSPEELAYDLAEFIARLIREGFRAQGISLPRATPGDIVLLCDTPKEFKYDGSPRLPLLLRRLLEEKGIKVFNPRGQPLRDIPCVQLLCGFLLECLDPGSQVQSSLFLQEAEDIFDRWRAEARNKLDRGAPPELCAFVRSWQKRTPSRRLESPSVTVPLTELIYKLITWIPEMQDDVEGLVYLEAIARTVSQSALISSFQGNIIFEPGSLEGERSRRSVAEILAEILAPVALNIVRIEEELLETLPSDRVNIMSIHQAKGLEFPVVIVDVGSDFRINHKAQAFRRFPLVGSQEHILEDRLREHSPLLGRPARPARDRAFDDLRRKFFVAYSRARDLLVLVGREGVKKGKIPHVALGWHRDNHWPWRTGIPHLKEI
ncbi:UvrD-helicase domain-containing protein [Desulfothermobacter acidiphilus]|uniref:UvrD-helicase domain-containing protein n=1 Tax=Desulfothermobacter acidiphilus TaxID=1938353 RepID=UPI003F8C6DC5